MFNVRLVQPRINNLIIPLTIRFEATSLPKFWSTLSYRGRNPGGTLSDRRSILVSGDLPRPRLTLFDLNTLHTGSFSPFGLLGFLAKQFSFPKSCMFLRLHVRIQQVPPIVHKEPTGYSQALNLVSLLVASMPATRAIHIYSASMSTFNAFAEGKRKIILPTTLLSKIYLHVIVWA